MALQPSGFLFGLAPSGVFPATTVASRAVRSYRTISPLPLVIFCQGEPKQKNNEAVYFLWHFP